VSAWPDELLEAIARAPHLEIAPVGADGSARSVTTIRVVRVGDELVVRSWNGPGGGWYRSAMRAGGGRVRVGRDEFDVILTLADVDRASVDRAYRDKYGRSRYVDVMTSDGPAATTLRLTPI